jgi:hypothetical protein
VEKEGKLQISTLLQKRKESAKKRRGLRKLALLKNSKDARTGQKREFFCQKKLNRTAAALPLEKFQRTIQLLTNTGDERAPPAEATELEETTHRRPNQNDADEPQIIS